MLYKIVFNKIDRFGNVLKFSIDLVQYNWFIKKKMDKMMEVLFNLNNFFRGEMKLMEYKGYWNFNRNDKQEK